MSSSGHSSGGQHQAHPHVAEARPDFLVVLGLVPPCTVEDVKQAYLTKVKTAHPDVGGDPAAFLKLQEAFERATQWAQFRASRLGWLSNWVEKYVEQDSLVSEIQRRGGKVHIEGVDWLRRSFGDDFSQVAEKLTGIEFHGASIDDRALDWLSSHRHSLSTLKSLDLSGTSVTDAGVQHVAAFPALRELDLSDTRVSSAALTVVRHLSELQWLGLHRTRVGWPARLILKLKYPRLQVAT
jgi:hypothetical protein